MRAASVRRHTYCVYLRGIYSLNQYGRASARTIGSRAELYCVEITTFLRTQGDTQPGDISLQFQFTTDIATQLKNMYFKFYRVERRKTRFQQKKYFPIRIRIRDSCDNNNPFSFNEANKRRMSGT